MTLLAQRLQKLLTEIDLAPTPEARLDAKLKVAWEYMVMGNPSESYRWCEEIEREALALQYQRGLAEAWQQWGFVANTLGKTQIALEKLEGAEKIFLQLEDKAGIASVIGRKGAVYWGMGNYDKGLEYAFQSLKWAQESPERLFEGYSNYLIGGYFFDLKDYAQSYQYYKTAYDIFEKLNEKAGMGRAMNGMANNLMLKGKYTEALAKLEASLLLHLELNNLNNLSRDYNDLGKLQALLGNTKEAFIFYEKALTIRREQRYLAGMATTLIELGELNFQTQALTEAIKYLEEAVNICKEIQSHAKLFRAYQILAQIYKQQGNFEQAYHYLAQFVSVKEETLGNENQTLLKNLKNQFETEKAQRESEIFRLRNVELKAAYDLIAQKNKDITASITYSQRIQAAILPNETTLSHILPQHFVLYQPRDIVSGDFYWAWAEGNRKIIVVADCTGHGVPGAIMTMLGNSLLNSLILERNIWQPHLILENLDKKVLATLHQSAQDGMDAAVVLIENNTLTFAGAKSSLIRLRKDKGQAKHQVERWKGSIFSIGGDTKIEKRFSTQSLNIAENDIFYLSTDGYQDQFGGAQNRKFSSRQFLEMLAQIAHLPLEAQKQHLLETHLQWKGEQKQTDDILVMGFMPFVELSES
ncbi:tetratricopeptide repeat protein [Hugenholtzia roseola]|uniref:tetratricopeptide repeat protein n=1 Tax=Hugenholtzia roseola TaxID=1002 RepID=UPI0003F8D436|nr:tetratricopeptide repeat protein [Hugenholtzia roseola]